MFPGAAVNILRYREFIHTCQKVGCEKFHWEEVVPVGTYAKNPAKIYEDSRLRLPVFELLDDHQNAELEKHLSQLV
jgi:hypothetical protein